MGFCDAINTQVSTQIINLDRSPERLALIAADLDGLGIAWTRLPAVDGRLLDVDRDPRVISGFDLVRWRTSHHRNPIATEIGCFLSHLAALRAFLASPRRFGLIFEDDARLDRHGPAAIAAALDDAGSWDILKLHARHPGPLIARRRYDAATLASFVLKPAGATAYIVSRAAAERMLGHMTPAFRPYDWMFDEGHRMRLKVRILSPMPVRLAETQSTIEAMRVKRRDFIGRQTDRPLAPRWALPFRRAADDVRRIAYNLLDDGGLVALARSPRAAPAEGRSP